MARRMGWAAIAFGKESSGATSLSPVKNEWLQILRNLIPRILPNDKLHIITKRHGTSLCTAFIMCNDVMTHMQ